MIGDQGIDRAELSAGVLDHPQRGVRCGQVRLDVSQVGAEPAQPIDDGAHAPRIGAPRLLSS